MRNGMKPLKQDTNSPTWREFDRKVKMLYCNTPSTIAKYNNTSELCWKGCGQVGELKRIFWDLDV